MASTLSVVIPARKAAATVGRAVAAVIDAPGVAEVIVVDDASSDDTSQVARAAGAVVVRLPTRSRPGGARNAGARIATGDIVAFLDADDEAEEDWAPRMLEAFEAGADLVAGALVGDHPETRGRPTPSSRLIPVSPRSTPFLPFGSGANLAVSRPLLEALGGFDDLFGCGEDADLCFRAQLAGHRLVPAPRAAVRKHSRQSWRALLRQVAKRDYWRRVLEWKYQHFAFAVLPPSATPQSPATEVAKGIALLVLGLPARPRWPAAMDAWAEAAVIAARRLGGCTAIVDIAGRRRAPEPVVPASSAAATTAGPLPHGPVALVGGPSPGVVASLCRGLRADPGLAAFPPLPAAEALARWQEAPPWSRRLAREAVASGWWVPPEVAARRLEHEAPATWGSAYLTMHAIGAWFAGRPRYVLAAVGSSVEDLLSRLPDVPFVAVGDDVHRHAAVSVTPRDLRADPVAVANRLAPVLGLVEPARVAASLRLVAPRWWATWT